MSGHRPITIQPDYWPEVQICELDREPWPCPASRKLPPEEAICPKCGQVVDVEMVKGQARNVTTTKVHLHNGKVCFAILKTKETR